ncbi:hypothetical protein HKD42_09600 [Altererythrobacter sp. RZ02]|uniref:Lipoprotein n=1 Tax=Pontixanthobacter rizhaonensis TaxID=2730337 RepID=A0A848QNQ6_9SPHN|nr:hypothetical protein [Pontixanthobacter rizhaonensis]NMW32313.1 hypothetical protein [Pontixanthobacter rizhaonensis]
MKNLYRGIIFTALVLTGCDTRTPVMSEEDIALVKEIYPTINDACVERARYEGASAINVSVDICFPMQSARPWTGLWVNEFEGSRFCPSPRSDCDQPEFGEGIWLSFAEGERPEAAHPYGDGTIYKVQFLGRRTKEPDSFGHYGYFAHEIVVDELISMETYTVP